MTVGRCFTPVSVWDGYYVRFDHVAQDTHPFWTRPDNQGRPVLLDDASTTASLIANHSHLLDGIITSGSQFSAFSSRFSRLRTSRPGGDDAVTYTILGVGLDEPYKVRHHRTNINLQLSKSSWWPFFAAHPPVSKDRFRTNGSHQINARELLSPVFTSVTRQQRNGASRRALQARNRVISSVSWLEIKKPQPV